MALLWHATGGAEEEGETRSLGHGGAEGAERQGEPWGGEARAEAHNCTDATPGNGAGDTPHARGAT